MRTHFFFSTALSFSPFDYRPFKFNVTKSVNQYSPSVGFRSETTPHRRMRTSLRPRIVEQWPARDSRSKPLREFEKLDRVARPYNQPSIFRKNHWKFRPSASPPLRHSLREYIAVHLITPVCSYASTRPVRLSASLFSSLLPSLSLFLSLRCKPIEWR